MTLKKTIGMGAAFIILLSVVVVCSYGYMMMQLTIAQEMENKTIEDSKTLNKGSLELNVWLDQMEQHVIEGWPFEGELDHKKTSHVKFISQYKPGTEDEKKIVSEIMKNHEMLHKTAKKLVATDDKEQKMDIYIDELKPYANAMAPLVGGVANLMNQRLYKMRSERINLQNKTGYFIIVSCLLIIAAIVIATILLFRKFIKPLTDVSDKIVLFGKGDLGVSVDYNKNNEIGDISRNFNKMVHSLNDILSGILSSSDKVVSSVEMLNQRAGKTADGARDQRSQTVQAATAAEEMSQTIIDISKNASVASNTSIEAMKIAHDGKKVSEGAIEIVNNVHSSTKDLSTMVDRLISRSDEIGNIIVLINEIADQTNLLALNAAIEAARAGEQGRGFAVVADEVRKLAERTINATAEISGKISAVQQESKQTSESMQEASDEVTKATEFIHNLGNSLEDIVQSVQQVSDQITHIATAVEEQSSASEDVTTNLDQTSKIANDMEKMSVEVQQEINALTNVSIELKAYTAGFRIKASDTSPDYPASEPVETGNTIHAKS